MISLIGMGLAVLMAVPTEAQIATDADFVGAHTVGSPDGGAGLPILGWSTTDGDLRIPHFVGMHALQLLPLFVLLTETLAARAGRRFTALRVGSARVGLVVVAAAAYTALLGLVTWQALRGQSIVRPDLWTGLAFAAIVAATALGARAAFAHGRRTLAAGPETAGVLPPPRQVESTPPTVGVGSTAESTRW